jgi:hypothetical protein
MIKIICPNCGKRLEAPEEAAGGKGKCPDCGMVFDVPGGRRLATKKEPIIRGLINCPECKKQCSSSAESCPHCGYKLPPKSFKLAKSDENSKVVLQAILIIGLLIWGVRACDRRSTQSEIYSKGMGHYRAAEYEKAAAVFQELLTLNPEHSRAKTRLDSAKERADLAVKQEAERVSPEGKKQAEEMREQQEQARQARKAEEEAKWAREEQLQAGRWEFISGVINRGIIHKVESSGPVVRIWVGPAFHAWPFEDKEKICHYFWAYISTKERNDAVIIYIRDMHTNNEIGTYRWSLWDDRRVLKLRN